MKNMHLAHRILGRGRLLVMVVMALLLASCASATQAPDPAADLLGKEWTLTELNGSTPLAGSTTTLTFEDGGIGGNAGCNSYGGKYALQGIKVSFQEVFWTEMACMEPDGIMQQETLFLQTLDLTASYEFVDGQLALKTPLEKHAAV